MSEGKPSGKEGELKKLMWEERKRVSWINPNCSFDHENGFRDAIIKTMFLVDKAKKEFPLKRGEVYGYSWETTIDETSILSVLHWFEKWFGSEEK